MPKDQPTSPPLLRLAELLQEASRTAAPQDLPIDLTPPHPDAPPTPKAVAIALAEDDIHRRAEEPPRPPDFVDAPTADVVRYVRLQEAEAKVRGVVAALGIIGVTLTAEGLVATPIVAGL